MQHKGIPGSPVQPFGLALKVFGRVTRSLPTPHASFPAQTRYPFSSAGIAPSVLLHWLFPHLGRPSLCSPNTHQTRQTPPPREVPGHHPRTVLSLQGTADVQMPCRTSAGAKVGKAIWKRTYLGCFTPLSCSSLLRANVSSCGVGVRGPQAAPSINTTHSIYHTVL